MTNPAQAALVTRPRVPFRSTSMAAGVLYLLTFVSIPTFGLYAAVKDDAGYIAGAGADTLTTIGALSEVIVALAGIGTGVALFPVIKRWNEGMALGFVAARTLEAAAIFAGVVAIMSIVSLRQSGVGDDALVVGEGLLAQFTWTTLLGQGMIPAFNALLLGPIMFRSRLLPRWLPLVGLVGAPFLLTGVVGMLFGLWGPVSVFSAVGAICLAVWEFGMGLFLVIRGFRPEGMARLVQADARRAAAIAATVAAAPTPGAHPASPEATR